MAKIESALIEIGALDELARSDSSLHRLDPRAKVLTTLFYLFTVVSYGKHDVAALLPLAAYPVALAALGGIPPGAILRRLLLASPFALFVAAFNPLLDRQILLHVGPLAVSGGWLSFASIMLRFCLTVAAALTMVALTGMNRTCEALERLGLPRIFAVQLAMLHRYIFVLVEEGASMARARSLRAFGGRGLGLASYAPLAGQLLLRAMDRAQRVHAAMLCRGFDGRFRAGTGGRFGLAEVLFISGWSAFFVIVRLYDLPALLGALLTPGGA